MSLLNDPWLRQMAYNQTAIESLKTFIGAPRGTVRAKVIDVKDPKEMGRIRVIFDPMNPEDIPQVEGSGSFSGAREGTGGNISHWIDACPAFKGQQPENLVGKRVNVVLSGEYHYAMLHDVIHDPQNLVDSSAAKLKMPNTSPMTRLPCYPAGQLPPATEENVGCTIVELAGPQGDDWLMVCLKRSGSYKWVRHIDRLHYHTGQLPDSDGDNEQRTYDDTIETTGSPKEGSD